MEFIEKEIKEKLTGAVERERGILPDSVRDYLDYMLIETSNDLMGGLGSDQSIEKCGSPVEQMFYIAVNRYFNEIYHYIDRGDQHDLFIAPQFKIKKYRVDFMIEIYRYNDDYSTTPIVRMLIEIDGHDFHEKTKAQVARDKKRDRTLSSECDALLRFSGSEIFKSPHKAAFEAYRIFLDKYLEKMSKLNS